MPWWVWMVVAFAVLSKVGRAARRMRRHGWHAMRAGPWMGWGMVVLDDRGMRRSCRHGGWSRPDRGRERAPEPAAPPVELSAAQKREQAIAELRRRYVADDITVDEYERELDRLLRSE